MRRSISVSRRPRSRTDAISSILTTIRNTSPASRLANFGSSPAGIPFLQSAQRRGRGGAVRGSGNAPRPADRRLDPDGDRPHEPSDRAGQAPRPKTIRWPHASRATRTRMAKCRIPTTTWSCSRTVSRRWCACRAVPKTVEPVDGNPLWRKKLAAGRLKLICFDRRENGLPAVTAGLPPAHGRGGMGLPYRRNLQDGRRRADLPFENRRKSKNVGTTRTARSTAIRSSHRRWKPNSSRPKPTMRRPAATCSRIS